MSVVNQMLRDLDRRQAGEDHRVFGQQLRPVDERRRGLWTAIAIGIVVLTAGGIGLYVFSMLTPGADVAAVAPPPAQPAAAPPPSLADSDAAASAGPATARQETDAAAVEPAKRETSPRAERPVSVTSKKGIAAASAPARVRSAPAEVPAAAKPRPSEAVALAPSKPAPPRAAPPSPLQPVTSAPTPEPSAPKIDKRFRDGPAPSAEGEFRRAVAFLDQGRMAESRAALRASLALEPWHEAARQTLAALLIEAGETQAAEQALEEGLRLNPAQANFAIVVARLRVNRDDTPGALAVLREHGAAAAGVPEYRAFVGALLQRLGRHAEAIDEYQAALKLAPGVGAWWIGLGLAQEAADRPKEAADAFRRAKASGTLPTELAEFVDRKLAASAR